MFYSITGQVVYQDEQSAAVSCGGVAFRLFSSRTTLGALSGRSGEVTLFTYLNVREDALDLFGFLSVEELDAFKLLIGVTGVGPKVALAILSALPPERFAMAVASADVKAFTAANGVGAKLAQRIVLELKDKIAGASFLSEQAAGIASAAASAGMQSNTSEAVSALVGLGYSQSEAATAIGRLDSSLSVEDLIKQALKNMTLRF